MKRLGGYRDFLLTIAVECDLKRRLADEIRQGKELTGDGTTDFIALVASAGVFSAILTGLLNWIGHLWVRARKARYLALRLAVVFENYAAACLSAIADHESAISSGDQIGQLAYMLPQAPILPQADEIWPMLNHEATSRALAFETEVLNFNSTTRFEIDVVGDVDHDRVVNGLCETALRALNLARDLRYRHEVGGLAENRTQANKIEQMRHDQRDRESTR